MRRGKSQKVKARRISFSTRIYRSQARVTRRGPSDATVETVEDRGRDATRASACRQRASLGTLHAQPRHTRQTSLRGRPAHATRGRAAAGARERAMRGVTTRVESSSSRGERRQPTPQAHNPHIKVFSHGLYTRRRARPRARPSPSPTSDHITATALRDSKPRNNTPPAAAPLLAPPDTFWCRSSQKAHAKASGRTSSTRP